MRLTKIAKRRFVRTKPDVRWLFPIIVIVIAGLLAFSAEVKERVAVRSRAMTPTTVVDKGH